MQHPDANLLYNPDPEYLRELVARSGLSQREAARRIGISERAIRQYLAHRDASTALDAPYPVQFALEHLPPFLD
jgi:transposase